MSASRILVFVVQTAITACAGLAVSRRVGSGRAWTLVVTTLTWAALLMIPAHALGYLHKLTFASLAAASMGLGACLLVLLRPPLAQLLASTRVLATTPMALFRVAWQRRSVVSIGVLVFAAVWVWLCATAWLAPMDPTTWDTFWYHEPMVGFAIQNRSFDPVHLGEYWQRINGFPRGCETVFLWFAMVFGRTLIDVGNLVTAPALVAAVYLLCRRVSADVLTCVGFGFVVLTIPGCLINLQTCHNDPMVAFLLASSVLLATAAPLDATRIAVASVALGMAVASKATALAPTAILSMIVLARAVGAHRRIPVRELVPIIVLGAALVVAMASAVYLRNLLWFHNPFWPEMKVDIPRLGIHWPGRAPYRLDGPPPTPEAQIDLNIPMAKLAEYAFQIPGSVHDFQYGDVQNYGLGILWFVVPLALVGAPVLLVDFVRSRLTHGAASRFPIGRGLYVLFMVALAVVLFTFTPARWAARYHLFTITLAVVVVAALTGRPGWRRLGEGACGAALVCALMHAWWANPRYWCTWKELKEQARLTRDEREFATERTPVITAGFGRLREQLLEGDLLLTRGYGLPGVLWNDAYSNRVEYVLDDEPLYDTANLKKANVVVVREGDKEMARFRDDKARWREVTQVNRSYNDFLAFRRIPQATE